MHAALGDGGFQGSPQRPEQAVGVFGLQGVDRRGRGELGLPEHLVREQVPDSGDLGLIEQTGLDGDRPLRHQGAELGRAHLLGIRTESADVRIQPDPTEPPLVEQHQAAAVGELEGEPVPLGLAWLGVRAAGPTAHPGLGRPGPLGGRCTLAGRRTLAGDHDPAAHPEVDAQVGTGCHGPADTGGLAPHRLSAPTGRGEHPADQGVTQLTGGMWAADERVGVVDGHDAPLQRTFGNHTASVLDLGKFWHDP
nr:hypothetical protein [Nakamurella sp. PAMC28650]